jgi:hypothetical protein
MRPIDYVFWTVWVLCVGGGIVLPVVLAVINS